MARTVERDVLVVGVRARLVEVLRRAVSNRATDETDDAVSIVSDGQHHTVAKKVDDRAVAVAKCETGVDHLVVGEAFGTKVLRECAGTVGRVADDEPTKLGFECRHVDVACAAEVLGRPLVRGCGGVVAPRIVHRLADALG